MAEAVKQILQPGCPFCERIAAREWTFIYPDSAYFEPLNPVTPGHLLVIPLHHVADATIDPDITARTMRAAAWLAGQSGESCNIITSVGETATQTVPHLHLHVVPRHLGDGLHLPWS